MNSSMNNSSISNTNTDTSSTSVFDRLSSEQREYSESVYRYFRTTQTTYW